MQGIPDASPIKLERGSGSVCGCEHKSIVILSILVVRSRTAGTPCVRWSISDERAIVLNGDIEARHLLG